MSEINKIAKSFSIDYILKEYNHDITLRNQSHPNDTIDQLGSKLLNINQKEKIPNYRLKNGKEVLLALEKADPTINKKYMIWIINQYKKEKFSLSDISQLRKDLISFENIKPYLKVVKKSIDIGRYDYFSLKNLISHYLEKKYEIKDIKNQVNNLINSPENPTFAFMVEKLNPHFLVRLDNWQAAVAFSSGSIGKPANWCIKNKDDFDAYTSIGHLLMVLDENTGEKFLIHPKTEEIKNRLNIPITYDELIKKYPLLEKKLEIYQNKGDKVGEFLKKLESLIDPEYLNSIGWYNIDNEELPPPVINKELNNDSEKNKFLELNDIDLSKIPEIEKTYEKCILALYKNLLKNIHYIPKKYDYLIEMMISSKLKNTFNSEDPLKEKEFLNLLEQKKIKLKDIPKTNRTFNICLHAILNDVNSFLQVPPNLRSDPLISLISVKNNPSFLSFLPTEFRNKDICELAVEKSSYAIEHVPLEHRSNEMIVNSVKRCGDVLQYITPLSLRTPKLCLLALNSDRQGRAAIKHIPNNYFSNLKFINYAVKINGYVLEEVPEKLKTLKLCLDAIKNSPLAISYVPFKMLRHYPKISIEAVTRTGHALQFIPEELRTIKICNAAIQNTGLALKHVPEELKTFELCLEAVKNNIYSLRYVPEEIRNQVKQTAEL